MGCWGEICERLKGDVVVASRLDTRQCSPDVNPSTLGFSMANIPHKSIGLSQK